MRQVTAINHTQAALDSLDIYYRELPCREGTFYFCTLPNGVTFDLQHNTDGTIKLWRFVAEVPISKAGTRWEYRNQEDSETALGLEVTNEGDVMFFAKQVISNDTPLQEARIIRMIKGYTNVISSVDFSYIKI